MSRSWRSRSREHEDDALAEVTAERDKLRRAYEQLKEQLELLRRRIFQAKAERVDVTQLEMEFAETQEARRARQADRRRAGGAHGRQRDEHPATPPSSGAKQYPKPTGRRNLAAEDMPEERVEIFDPALEGIAERIDFEESFQAANRRGGPVRVVVARCEVQDGAGARAWRG